MTHIDSNKRYACDTQREAQKLSENENGVMNLNKIRYKKTGRGVISELWGIPES